MEVRVGEGIAEVWDGAKGGEIEWEDPPLVNLQTESRGAVFP